VDDFNQKFLKEMAPTPQEMTSPYFDGVLLMGTLLTSQPSNGSDWVDG